MSVPRTWPGSGALVIWASAFFAGYESYEKLVGGAPTKDAALGMVGAALGIVGNQIVARYKLRVGRRIRSATMIADAKHSWLDTISSLGALVGLALVAAGYQWGDPVAGLAVTLFICHVGVEVTRDLLHRLMDGVDPEHLDAARTAAADVPGVDAGPNALDGPDPRGRGGDPSRRRDQLPGGRHDQYRGRTRGPRRGPRRR